MHLKYASRNYLDCALYPFQTRWFCCHAMPWNTVEVFHGTLPAPTRHQRTPFPCAANWSITVISAMAGMTATDQFAAIDFLNTVDIYWLFYVSLKCVTMISILWHLFSQLSPNPELPCSLPWQRGNRFGKHVFSAMPAHRIGTRKNLPWQVVCWVWNRYSKKPAMAGRVLGLESV